MSPADQPPIRVGNAERAAAMTALDEHLAQGRLNAEEYGDRSAQAVNATTADELAALFADLPAPHPTLPGFAGAPPTASSQRAPAYPAPQPVERRESAFDRWGPKLVMIAPVLALLLFFVTRQWWWFLLIPIVMTLVHGGRRR